MKIFFGAAIQGKVNRNDRSEIYKAFLETIKEAGHQLISEHATACSFEENVMLMEKTMGPLPPVGIERTKYVRNKIIEFIEGPIDAAIFEVSTPSLGTGIEIAHAYLRPRMGLKAIPILTLYEKDYWPGKLSSMIKGLTPAVVNNFYEREFSNIKEGQGHILEFLRVINS